MNNYRDGSPTHLNLIGDDEEDDLASCWSLADEPIEMQPELSETRHCRVEGALHGSRLDKIIAQWIPEFSRSHLQNLIRQGQVKVDGKVEKVASSRAVAGSEIVIELTPTAQSLSFRAEPIALDIVHEDDHLMVIHKPAGLVVHPAAGHWSGTLLNGLLSHHPGAVNLPRAGIVHRLDKDTSGLMVVGKTVQSVLGLTRAIAGREVKRTYLAVVHGRWVLEQCCIEAPIGRDPRSRTRMAVVAGGKPAKTDVFPWSDARWFGRAAEGASPEAGRSAPARVVSAASPAHGFPAGSSASARVISRVVCQLQTGRTHQIRVHMSHRGFPLVGDTLYGGRSDMNINRQALHAWRLGFSHPVTGLDLQFEASPPDDFNTLWRLSTQVGV
jgi:23S rRNA pseudouridine1911/1915/1917 synthase